MAACAPKPTSRGVLDELRASGGAVHYDAADLASCGRSRAARSTTLRARFGAVHALVNNAGRAPRVRADLLDATEESFDELIGTNLRARTS